MGATPWSAGVEIGNPPSAARAARMRSARSPTSLAGMAAPMTVSVFGSWSRCAGEYTTRMGPSIGWAAGRQDGCRDLDRTVAHQVVAVGRESRDANDRPARLMQGGLDPGERAAGGAGLVVGGGPGDERCLDRGQGGRP